MSLLLILRCERKRASKDAGHHASIAERASETRRSMNAFVYMLRCSDGSYYVGSARGCSREQRLAQHQAGSFGGYTSTRRPVTLVYSETFERVEDAVAAERKLKGWSRAKKEALARGDFSALRRLASRRAGKDVRR
jgi:putative endonuclease